jgi:hypothetical protein
METAVDSTKAHSRSASEGWGIGDIPKRGSMAAAISPRVRAARHELVPVSSLPSNPALKTKLERPDWRAWSWFAALASAIALCAGYAHWLENLH